jgi:hypothetical protein
MAPVMTSRFKMSNYPPGVSEREVCGLRCPQCGAIDGCDCEDDGDPRSFRQRRADEIAEDKFECDRQDGLI